MGAHEQYKEGHGADLAMTRTGWHAVWPLRTGGWVGRDAPRPPFEVEKRLAELCTEGIFYRRAGYNDTIMI